MITFSLGNGNTVTCNQWKVFLSSAVFHVDLCGQSNAMSAAAPVDLEAPNGAPRTINEMRLNALTYPPLEMASSIDSHSILANSGIYVRKTKISEISGGKIDFDLRVRVINLWSTPDRNNPAEEGAIHMIFLDEREILASTKEDRYLDVIGHVVEKTAMKETEKNDAGWFYQACTKCSSRIGFIGGQLYCQKCRLPRTAIPKFKVHLEVIDNTGSITFILFDRVVSQVVGRTAQDLLDSISDNQRDSPFPSELDVFVNKRMLFKVEVTDANLYRNWRGYTVKKLSDEETIITRFTELHGINFGCSSEYALDGAGADGADAADYAPLGVIEGVDSSVNEDVVSLGETQTPNSKFVGNKDAGLGDVQRSSTKKLFVNIEDSGLVDSDISPTTKSIGKRSANTHGVEVTAPKETKMTYYGTSLIANNNVNEITCTTNGEEYDIPNNEDVGSHFGTNNDVDQMLCASNTEEYDIPSNSDCGAFERSLSAHPRQMLRAPYLPPVDDPSFATYLNIGQPNHVCSHCGAIMWLEERLKSGSKRNPIFSLCCSQGDIEIVPYTKLPHPLHNLYHGLDNRSKFFLDNIRMQDDALAIRSSIVKDIRQALDNCENPYVQTYNTIRNTIHFEGIPTIRLRILGKRGRDGRRYNLPTASEVAALVVGDFDAADFERDIIVEERSGLLKRISAFKPSYWPLQYPLLFPRGEDGYRKDIEFRDNERKASRKRLHITQLEWVAYRIQQREIENSTIVFARRLFHQFLVDSFSTIESARLKYLRDHQQELRSDMYKGLTEAILRGQLSRPNIVWNNTWEELSDDIQHKQRRLMNCQDLVLTPEQLKSYALAEIDALLQSNNKSLRNFPDMPQPDPGLLPDRGNRLIYDELNYDRQALADEHRKLMSTMTTEQRGVPIIRSPVLIYCSPYDILHMSFGQLNCMQLNPCANGDQHSTVYRNDCNW
ncbi:hypothetical protein QL285_084180 [Trifolium repens]|nr:hypothetical protein QL285_084180 [Trifolium repens]